MPMATLPGRGPITTHLEGPHSHEKCHKVSVECIKPIPNQTTMRPGRCHNGANQRHPDTMRSRFPTVLMLKLTLQHNCCTFGSTPTGWRFSQPQLSPPIATEAFQAAPLTPVVGGPVGRIVGERGGRQSTLPCIQSAHNSQGRNSHKPGLFITGIGMAAYIQWRRIPKGHIISIK